MGARISYYYWLYLLSIYNGVLFFFCQSNSFTMILQKEVINYVWLSEVSLQLFVSKGRLAAVPLRKLDSRSPIGIWAACWGFWLESRLTTCPGQARDQGWERNASLGVPCPVPTPVGRGGGLGLPQCLFRRSVQGAPPFPCLCHSRNLGLNRSVFEGWRWVADIRFIIFLFCVFIF